MTQQRELLVVDLGTGHTVKRIDVTGKSDNAVGRIMAGMLINMHPNFCVSDTADAAITALQEMPDAAPE